MKLTSAIMIACEAHEGQTDKAGEPYIFHPLRVMMSLTDDKHRIVAVLHDVAEDYEFGWDRIKDGDFGEDIEAAVDALTRRDGEPYSEFISRCGADPIARVVKLADIEDNLRPERSSSLPDSLWARYLAGREALKEDGR